MSEKKKEAVELLQRMPEDKVDFVIEFIRQLEIQTEESSGLTTKMQAFQRLEALKQRIKRKKDSGNKKGV